MRFFVSLLHVVLQDVTDVRREQQRGGSRNRRVREERPEKGRYLGNNKPSNQQQTGTPSSHSSLPPSTGTSASDTTTPGHNCPDRRFSICQPRYTVISQRSYCHLIPVSRLIIEF